MPFSLHPLLFLLFSLAAALDAFAAGHCFADADTGICAGGSITLRSPQNGATAYLWSTGATTQSITVSPGATTTYSVTATFSPSTSITDDFTVNVENKMPAPTIKADSSFITSSSCAGCQVRWYRNNLLTTVTRDTFFFPLEGVYFSETSYGAYCWSRSGYLYYANDRDTATLPFTTTVYPNPSTGYFNIDVVFPRMLSSVIKVEVFSIGGTSVFRSEPFFYRTVSSRIPVRLPAGFLGQAIVQLTLPGRTPQTTKILVQ